MTVQIHQIPTSRAALANDEMEVQAAGGGQSARVTAASVAALGGGGGSGGARVIGPIVINFDDAGLVAGKSIYTPTVGDVWLNGWISVATAWNGTTPIGDIGLFDGITNGAGILADMTGVDYSGGSGIGNGATVTQSSLMDKVWPYGMRFTAANPVKICISTSGLNTGSDPGASQGVAHVFLVVATPVAP